MRLLCNQHEFKKAKSTDFLPLECSRCSSTFYQRKSTVERAIGYIVGLNNSRKTLEFCSPKCSDNRVTNKAEIYTHVCTTCQTEFQSDRKDSKFCGRQCKGKHDIGRNRKISKNRSKAEAYLFNRIRHEFPEIALLANDRAFLEGGLEIDIFLPELSLAIEVNGPFHYRPIYGEERLERAQHNDQLKKENLENRSVELLSLDISGPEHKSWKASKIHLEALFQNIIKPLVKGRLRLIEPI